MAEEVVIRVVLAVIVGVLFGIVYCMRVLVLMERRVARIEEHMDNIMHKVLQEEIRIERGMKRKR
jgi:HAMP domain-containing protein